MNLRSIWVTFDTHDEVALQGLALCEAASSVNSEPLLITMLGPRGISFGNATNISFQVAVHGCFITSLGL